jgi:SAM-dependent methyltransferase
MHTSETVEKYQTALEAEKHLYANCTDVHDLPPIFHYWSNRYLRPKLSALGFADAPGMFRKHLDLQCRARTSGLRRFLSLGSGNCDLEIRLATELCESGHRDFLIDCIELNPVMLERATLAAHDAGVERYLNFTVADLNSWIPSVEYDAAMACHSLHHVVNLEGVFDGVRSALRPRGIFLIADMIGRNGHQRWPEALDFVNEFWRKLPPSYRFHRILQCYEERFENRDCSVEGFEGIRSQDILPLLIDRFHFQLFAGFANIIDPFVDRAFGPNFDAMSDWDRNFIDEVHRRDQQELDSGRLKPTQMLAVVGNEACDHIAVAGRPPKLCVRTPELTVVRSAIRPAYEWGSWPHGAERELQTVCGMLADSGTIISRTAAWAVRLEHELQKRTEWALRLEKQLEERTQWACRLENDLNDDTLLVARLRDEIQEKSAWALKLDADRIQFEERLRSQAALIAQLETEVDARSTWALRLQDEVEAERQKRQSLQAELRSYLHNPLRFVMRLAA